LSTHIKQHVQAWYYISKAALSRISRDCIMAFAGQASFFLMLSAIPFLLLLFALVRLWFPDLLPDLLDLIRLSLPPTAHQVLSPLLLQLSEKTDVSLLSISGIALLLSSSRGIRSVSEGIRSAYRTRFSVPFWKKQMLSLAATALLAISILLSITSMPLLDGVLSLILPSAPDIQSLFTVLQPLSSILLLYLLFLILFRLLSSDVGSISSHSPGALFSAIGWKLFTYGFTIYATHYARYDHLYGSLSVLVLLMLWIYFCMVILLLGAEINAMIILATQSFS